MKRYYFCIPGYGYSLKVEDPVKSMKSAKQWIREWLGVERLPKGTEIYSFPS